MLGADRGLSAPAARWFDAEDVGQGVTLFTESYVHDFARCNIWLVAGRDADLLVDSGCGLVPLLPFIRARRGTRPIIAVGTHIHFDHIGGHHEFADRRAHAIEAPAYAAMDDADTLAPLFRTLAAPVSAPPAPGWNKADYRIDPAPIDRPLADGDVIDLGDRRFAVLHLPGHSPGSIGLFEAETGILFAGDALYDGGLIDDFAHSNVDAYRDTMTRLAALTISIGHGGHGPSFGEARKQVLIADYLAGRRAQGCPQ